MLIDNLIGIPLLSMPFSKYHKGNKLGTPINNSHFVDTIIVFKLKVKIPVGLNYHVLQKLTANDLLVWNEAFQHQVMSSAYVDPMVAALTEIFPALPLNEAIALGWGGLQGTISWNNMATQDPVAFN